jgi:hypothetical protein
MFVPSGILLIVDDDKVSACFPTFNFRTSMVMARKGNQAQDSAEPSAVGDGVRST